VTAPPAPSPAAGSTAADRRRCVLRHRSAPNAYGGPQLALEIRQMRLAALHKGVGVVGRRFRHMHSPVRDVPSGRARRRGSVPRAAVPGRCSRGLPRPRARAGPVLSERHHDGVGDGRRDPATGPRPPAQLTATECIAVCAERGRGSTYPSRKATRGMNGPPTRGRGTVSRHSTPNSVLEPGHPSDVTNGGRGLADTERHIRLGGRFTGTHQCH
jgi:hypothetical protein